MKSNQEGSHSEHIMFENTHQLTNTNNDTAKKGDGTHGH
jgi:hypothetical protein